MPTVRLPSATNVQIHVVTEHVTHTVFDARTADAALSINLISGATVYCRVDKSVTLDELLRTQTEILTLINDAHGVDT